MDPKQSQHALEQKVLRTIMDENGVTRSQARKVFHEALIADRLAGRAPDQIALRKQEERKAPVIRRQEVEIKPPQVKPALPNVVAVGGGGISDGTWITVDLCGHGPIQVLTRPVP